MKQTVVEWLLDQIDDMYLHQIYSKEFELAKEIEKQQKDDFAIGFAEWFADNTLRVDLDGYKTFGDTDETKPHTVKELLEIYKKEKGL